MLTPLIIHNNPTNKISTTKYNIITFLPFSLLIQFKRLANVYFLMTAVLQAIPEISTAAIYSSAFIPLVLVLIISMTREGI
jgi:hypothetical protein